MTIEQRAQIICQRFKESGEPLDWGIPPEARQQLAQAIKELIDSHAINSNSNSSQEVTARLD